RNSRTILAQLDIGHDVRFRILTHGHVRATCCALLLLPTMSIRIDATERIISHISVEIKRLRIVYSGIWNRRSFCAPINVVPKKLKDGENIALTTPVTVTGTAEELDAELASTL